LTGQNLFRLLKIVPPSRSFTRQTSEALIKAARADENILDSLMANPFWSYYKELTKAIDLFTDTELC
jgi:hypothetical protein